MKDPWSSIKSQGTERNWSWLQRQKLLDCFVYFKVGALTYGHPANSSGPCHLSHSLNSVSYFPPFHSSLLKCFKALESKTVLNVEERRNWKLHWETSLALKPKGIKTHERSKESCKDDNAWINQTWYFFSLKGRVIGVCVCVCTKGVAIYSTMHWVYTLPGKCAHTHW